MEVIVVSMACQVSEHTEICAREKVLPPSVEEFAKQANYASCSPRRLFSGHERVEICVSVVKQGREGPWLRYDMNGHVAPVSSDREVLEGNYGGDRNRKHVMHLTYIREDSIDAFFAERDSTSPAFYSSCYIYFLAVLVLLTFFLTGWRC